MRASRLVPLATFLLVCSCGSPGGLHVSAQDALRIRSVPLPALVVPVPLVTQKYDYTCGDAVALALLRYWKHQQYKQVPESALYAVLGTTEKNGTEPRPITDLLEREPGLRARLVDTTPDLLDLERAVDRGEPPIVDLEAWQDVPSWKDLRPWKTDWADGHYAVLVAYDADNFFFMDPSTARHYAYIPRRELLDRWHDVVGKRRTQHLTIFVSGATEPYTPDHPLPPLATPID